jgi:hypothetical protein
VKRSFCEDITEEKSDAVLCTKIILIGRCCYPRVQSCQLIATLSDFRFFSVQSIFPYRNLGYDFGTLEALVDEISKLKHLFVAPAMVSIASARCAILSDNRKNCF